MAEQNEKQEQKQQAALPPGLSECYHGGRSEKSE